MADGHGGHQCAAWLAHNLHRIVIDASAPLLESGQQRDLLQAVSFAMAESEARWMSEAEKLQADAGSCLTTILLQGSLLAVGNVGDCRAVHIAPDGVLTQLTAEHRADDPQEEARITAEGGRVKNGYLNGVLQPSRTIGDRDEKLAPRGGLIARPFISCMRLPDPPSREQTQQSLSKTDKADLRRQALHLRKPPGSAGAAQSKKKGRKGGRQRSGSVSSTGASPLQTGLASAGDETPYGVLGVPDEFGLVALDDMLLTPAAGVKLTSPSHPSAAAGSSGGSSGEGHAQEGPTAHRIRADAPSAASEWDSSDNEAKPVARGKAPPSQDSKGGSTAQESQGQRRRRRRNKARKNKPKGQHEAASGAVEAATPPAHDDTVDPATAAAIAQAYRELNGRDPSSNADAAGEWTTVTAKTGASQAAAKEAAAVNAVVAPPAAGEPAAASDPPSPSTAYSPTPSAGTQESGKGRRRRQRQRKKKQGGVAAAPAPPSASAAPPPIPAPHQAEAQDIAAAAPQAEEHSAPTAPVPPMSPLQRAVQGFATGGAVKRGPCVASLPPAEAPDQLDSLQQNACIWQLPAVSALIVASDGVWDTLSNDEASLIVAQVLQAHGSAEEAARTLVRSARSRGSEDDITALVLWFTPEGDEGGLVTM